MEKRNKYNLLWILVSTDTTSQTPSGRANVLWCLTGGFVVISREIDIDAETAHHSFCKCLTVPSLPSSLCSNYTTLSQSPATNQLQVYPSSQRVLLQFRINNV